MKNTFNQIKTNYLNVSRVFATIAFDGFTFTCTESKNRPVAAFQRALSPFDQRRNEANRTWNMLSRVAKSALPRDLRLQYAFSLR